MTAYEVGLKLVEMCNQGQNLEFINNYYANSIISVEASENPGNPDMPRTMEGLDQIRGKNQWWFENHELHDGKVQGPFPHGDDRFAVLMSFDVTFKPTGDRMQLEEVGVFTVDNGKVTKEEFFYHMG